MTARPYTVVNMAMTADGKITSAGREYPKFTSPADRTSMDRLRAEADALLVGAGTMRADDPKLHVRERAMREYRASLGKPAGLDRVLVTASASLDPDSRFLDDTHGGRSIVATVDDAPAGRLRALEARAEVWRVGTGRVDFPELFRRLREDGVERLLVEGGGEINWEVVRHDLLDELYVTVAPALLGGRDAPTLLEGDGFPMTLQRRLELLDVRREGDELYLRWRVRRGRESA